MSIQDLQATLEKLLRDGGITIVERPDEFARTHSAQLNVAQVVWSGFTDDRRITFLVQIIVPLWREIGDTFLKTWELILNSEDWSPLTPVDVNYGEQPLGYDKELDFVSFPVASCQVLDVLKVAKDDG